MSTNNQKTLVIALAILSIVLLGTTIYTCNSVKTLTVQLDDTTKAKQFLDSQVVVLDAQIASLERDTTRLNQELKAKLQEIRKLRAQLAKALKAKKIATKTAMDLQKQVDALNQKIKDLEAEIERLKAENKLLRDSNTLLVYQKAVVTKTKDSILEVGSQLKAANIAFIPDGKIWFLGKTRIIEKAKQVKTITITFDLQNNPFAMSGTKQLFVVLIKPDGKVFSPQVDSSLNIRKQGEPFTFSYKTQAEFKQGEYTRGITNKLVLANTKETLTAGTYIINIYDNTGFLMGSTTYSLK